MSEVNQAFLRAYLKNRTAQMRDGITSQASSMDAISGSIPLTSRQNNSSSGPQPKQVPVATTIRQTAPMPRSSNVVSAQVATTGIQSEQPIRSAQAGENLRIDPSHGSIRSQPAAPLNQVSQAAPQSHPTRGGVWSPLGAERGMKAMESSKASPAVVRNGVEAVSSQAALPTRLQTHPAHTSIPAPHSDLQHVANESSLSNQVQFVDGLRGHVGTVGSSGSRTSERTLSEITQPIAFGTGLSSSDLTTSSSQTIDRRTEDRRTEPQQETMPRREQDSRNDRANETPTFRRFDHAHSAKPVLPATLAPATDTPSPTQVASPSDQLRSDDSPQQKTTGTAFSGSTALPLPVAFTPSWEVDCFLWPEVVKQIERSHAQAFQQIGKHLSIANRDGLRVMAVTSGERGVGRSTVAMHMARSAAASGLKVALIDGDAFCPSLIDQLRLDVEHGWADCLFENVPLHETAIHSIQDGITLFPLKSVISAQELHANLHRMAKLIKRISTTFDIVFIDANRLNLEQRDMVGVSQESVIDAAIVVVDTELSIKEKVDSAVGILQSMGLSSIGLVENFQS